MIWDYPGPAQISIRAPLFELKTRLESEVTGDCSGREAKQFLKEE
jgi:hypothetical protein